MLHNFLGRLTQKYFFQIWYSISDLVFAWDSIIEIARKNILLEQKLKFNSTNILHQEVTEPEKIILSSGKGKRSPSSSDIKRRSRRKSILEVLLRKCVLLNWFSEEEASAAEINEKDPRFGQVFVRSSPTQDAEKDIDFSYQDTATTLSKKLGGIYMEPLTESASNQQNKEYIDNQESRNIYNIKRQEIYTFMKESTNSNRVCRNLRALILKNNSSTSLIQEETPLEHDIVDVTREILQV